MSHNQQKRKLFLTRLGSFTPGEVFARYGHVDVRTYIDNEYNLLIQKRLGNGKWITTTINSLVSNPNFETILDLSLEV